MLLTVDAFRVIVTMLMFYSKDMAAGSAGDPFDEFA